MSCECLGLNENSPSRDSTAPKGTSPIKQRQHQANSALGVTHPLVLPAAAQTFQVNNQSPAGEDAEFTALGM